MADDEGYVAWRNHFLVLLDRIPTPIAVCRADGEITVANPAMAAEWGLVPGQVRGRNLLDLFRPSSSASAQLGRLAEALRLGRRSRYTIDVRWLQGAAGAEREGELLVDPVGDPGPGYPMLLAVLRVREGAVAPPRPSAEVSAVEGRILALVASGATTAAVGKAVGLTVDGVNYHLARLTRRWRVPNRTALVAKAYVLGVLSPGQWPPAAPDGREAGGQVERGGCRNTQSPHSPPEGTR
ncbi:PAS domain S-box-containing protein [Streptomyces olivoverticillatus]|uniref:PAS domain S-box-containing protein n=1 Tax=Streptomyces olivoverticillatus TaxID=66427 RepID=A0A7W7LN84_9ACTN|nr:PAS domain-containing protein [Streptomyces olivoverticillatus]MBB4893202.1 PAS domain S-box-containing protein [Streptomyces olivoverticillatus]